MPKRQWKCRVAWQKRVAAANCVVNFDDKRFYIETHKPPTDDDDIECDVYRGTSTVPTVRILARGDLHFRRIRKFKAIDPSATVSCWTVIVPCWTVTAPSWTATAPSWTVTAPNWTTTGPSWMVPFRPHPGPANFLTKIVVKLFILALGSQHDCRRVSRRVSFVFALRHEAKTW